VRAPRHGPRERCDRARPARRHWQNANDTILGADNKAAVAVLLALAARLVATPHEAGVELLFTIGEEVGLIGAKEFEMVSCEVPSATPSTLRCRSAA